MQQLYSDASLQAVNQKLKRRYILLGAVLAVLLAVFIWAMITRVEWAAMVSACLAGVFSIFFVELFCLPHVRYRRLIRSALSGRRHTRDLVFDHSETEVSTVEGIPCRSLIFLGDPDKHGSREMLLYWDNEFPLPALVPQTVYTVDYTGKNIIGLREAPSSRP